MFGAGGGMLDVLPKQLEALGSLPKYALGWFGAGFRFRLVPVGRDPTWTYALLGGSWSIHVLFDLLLFCFSGFIDLCYIYTHAHIYIYIYCFMFCLFVACFLVWLVGLASFPMTPAEAQPELVAAAVAADGAALRWAPALRGERWLALTAVQSRAAAMAHVGGPS